jgi:glycosyltransferase involved in cell wall biosynthesis
MARHRQVRVLLVTSPNDVPSIDGLSTLSNIGIDVTTFPEADLAAAGRWLALVADLTAMVAPRLANRMLPKFGSGLIDETEGDLWFFKSTLLAGRRLPESGRVMVDLDDLEERTLHPRLSLAHLLHRVHLVAQRRRAIAIACVSLVCSERDRHRLRRFSKIDVLPNTYLLPESMSPIVRKQLDPIVAMIGRMSYAPNREGAEWFASECWPRIRDQVPTAHCRLIGEDANLLTLHPETGIEVIADAPDAIACLCDVAVSAAPILRGSGTRTKILESMALGIPVVSTTIGAEGLDVTDGNDILLRDSPGALAEGIALLLNDPILAQKIGLNGKALFDSTYGFDRFQERVDTILDESA